MSIIEFESYWVRGRFTAEEESMLFRRVFSEHENSPCLPNRQPNRFLEATMHCWSQSPCGRRDRV